jgi:radical SAM-linked protein
MARPQPDREVIPVVQRLRIRYAKRGRLRFTSHRDFSRALERAVRRAALPIAYSAGFSPHPKISYIGAAPTGVASEAEYVEIGLAQRCDPAQVAAALDASLPAGLDVLECVEGSGGSLADRMEASEWLLEVPVEPAALRAAVDTFLSAESVEVERMTKDGRRRFDARGAVLALQVTDTAPDATVDGTNCGILHMVVRHVTPAVRPDDVLSGLRAAAGFEVPDGVRVTRLCQGLLGDDGHIGDPLAADRLPAGHPVG